MKVDDLIEKLKKLDKLLATVIKLLIKITIVVKLIKHIFQG